MSQMTPREIVHELGRHIIGQESAKRAVAIALRNRWRRMQLEPALRAEVAPKNILMIGPTGVGKTEIARRLAKLAKAPFIKVEATKFTEVGYVGKDVESIIRDLVDVAVKMRREEQLEKVGQRAEYVAEERILDALLREHGGAEPPNREALREQLRAGHLDAQLVELNVQPPKIGMEIMSPPGMEEMANQLQEMLSGPRQDRPQRRKIPIGKARGQLRDEEAANLIDEDDIKTQALAAVEQTGIVFIDELDKVAKRSQHSGTDISREGVQRDLLPLIEGATVSTKYGHVKTDHVLFIASGAFHLSKPSDLIPELQGRLPIRVELAALSAADFERILTEPDASLSMQYQALLQTEGVQIEFTAEGLRRISELAYAVNESTENIGARRLHTLMERLLEELSFEASDREGQSLRIDTAYVDEKLAELAQDEDLSRFIL